MKFSGYLPLHENTSAIDFGPVWCIRSAGHSPKVGRNELHCASVCKTEGCYRYILFNYLVLAVPKTGQMSESGTFSKCTVVLVSRFLPSLNT